MIPIPQALIQSKYHKKSLKKHKISQVSLAKQKNMRNMKPKEVTHKQQIRRTNVTP
jgi:hypothetical protein